MLGWVGCWVGWVGWVGRSCGWVGWLDLMGWVSGCWGVGLCECLGVVLDGSVFFSF